jgi:hypothetical protein
MRTRTAASLSRSPKRGAKPSVLTMTRHKTPRRHR